MSINVANNYFVSDRDSKVVDVKSLIFQQKKTIGQYGPMDKECQIFQGLLPMD